MTTDEAITHLDTVAELRRELRKAQGQAIAAQSGLVAVMCAALGARDARLCFSVADRALTDMRALR